MLFFFKRNSVIILLIASIAIEELGIAIINIVVLFLKSEKISNRISLYLD